MEAIASGINAEVDGTRLLIEMLCEMLGGNVVEKSSSLKNVEGIIAKLSRPYLRLRLFFWLLEFWDSGEASIPTSLCFSRFCSLSGPM